MVVLTGDEENQQQLFSIGMRVEVSSDEDGFRGAWYRASIIESSPKSASKRKKKVLVQYETLVTDDGSSPLTEYVHPSHIRPLPPGTDTDGRYFEENDTVDAAYRDGWWTGTVRKVLEGGSRYRVYFDNPPDVIDFDGKDLRVHWDRLFDKWVKPEKQQMVKSIFSSGTAVEVNPDDDPSLGDVWFPAIIVKTTEDDDFWVKYFSVDDGEDTDAIRIYVDLLHIRPIPPNIVGRSYGLLEDVDTSHGTGWRTGKVNKLLVDGRYSVFFKQKNEEKVFSSSELRPHLDWIGGKWISMYKDISISSDCQGESGYAINSSDKHEVIFHIDSAGASCNSELTGELEGNYVLDLTDEQSTPDINKSVSTPRSKKRTRTLVPDRCLRFAKADLIEDRAEVSLSTSEKFKEHPPGFATLKKCGSEKRKSEHLNVHCDSSQLERSISEKKLEAKRLKFEGQGRERASATKKQLSVSKVTQVSKEGMNRGIIDIASAVKCKDRSQDNIKIKDIGFRPNVLALRCNESINRIQVHEGPLEVTPVQSEKANYLLDNKTPESSQQKSAVTGHKRKLGRPCKFVVKDLNATDTGEKQKQLALVSGDCMLNLAPICSHKKKRGRPSQSLAKEPNSDETHRGEVQQFEQSVVGGDGTFNITDELPLVEWVYSTGTPHRSASRAVISSKECNMNSNMAISIVSDAGLDTEPLRISLRDDHASPIIEEVLSNLLPSRSSLEDDHHLPFIEEVLSPLNEIPNAFSSEEIETPLSIIAPSLIACLPFVKKSPIWPTVESLEAFQKLPQDPHFYPLAESESHLREGYAIGFAITFSSLFDQVSSLRLDNPTYVFNTLLDNLRGLEKYGFDITKLESRINDLLAIKDGHVRMQDECKDAEEKLNEHMEESAKVSEERMEIEKKLLAKQKEEMEMKMKMEVKQLEICKLRLCAENVKKDFEKTIAAGWNLP